MAYYIVDANNKAPSSAKSGDIVVTGGGIWEKTDGASVRRQDLEEKYGYTTTGSYQKVVDTYNRITGQSSGGSSGGGGGSTKTTTTTTTTAPDPEIDTSTDVNGIWYLGGYDFPGAPTYSSTGDANAVKNFFGYILLGLIALVILDRAIGK